MSDFVSMILMDLVLFRYWFVPCLNSDIDFPIALYQASF
jgi:hypothetical protein